MEMVFWKIQRSPPTILPKVFCWRLTKERWQPTNDTLPWTVSSWKTSLRCRLASWAGTRSTILRGSLGRMERLGWQQQVSTTLGGSVSPGSTLRKSRPRPWMGGAPKSVEQHPLEESLLGTGGNCWRIDRSQQSPTRLQNPPTANSFLIRGKAVDTLESIFWVISNTFMCLNSFIGTSSQPTSKTRALPTQAFWSEGKSYQCSQSRLLGALRQTFIKDIK